MRWITMMVLWLPLAGLAQQDPAALYAQYHRHAVMGEIEMAGNLASVTLRKGLGLGMAGYSSADARRAAIAKMNTMMPAAYSISRRTMSPDKNTMLLSLRGRLDRPIVQATSGEIRMVKELGAWKVDSVAWRGDKQGAEQQAAETAQPRIKYGPTSPAQARPATRAAPPTPARKLGRAAEPCVFKPTMTAEDLARCK
ncbi:MAG: hypothetical protein ACRET8_07565 [Burkholderiales bacterium]